jgi:hypothetical protein
MMPYMIDWSAYIPLDKGGIEGGFREENKTGALKIGHAKSDVPTPHHSLYAALTQSTNKYEQASGWLNLTLEYYTQHHQIDTIIHHYYTADIQFP